MDAKTLEALAERCAGASADQQREMLEAAFVAVHGPKPPRVHGGSQEWLDWLALYNPFYAMLEAKAYESAAITLVPEGWSFSAYSPGAYLGKPSAMMKHPDRNPAGCGPVILCHAATTALALCASCLRALATKEPTNV